MAFSVRWLAIVWTSRCRGTSLIGRAVNEDRREGIGDLVRAGRRVVAAPVLRAERADDRTLLAAIAQMWVCGNDVDWASLFDGSGAKRVALPTYAFQRERYWLQAGASGAGDVGAAGLSAAEHPLLGAMVGLADGGGWLFTGRVSLSSHRWLADHVVFGTAMLAGTAFVEIALHAGAQVGCELLRELILETPLVLGEGEEVQLQLAVGEPDGAGCRSVQVHSRVMGDSVDGGPTERTWMRNASGTLAPGTGGALDGWALAVAGISTGRRLAKAGSRSWVYGPRRAQLRCRLGICMRIWRLRASNTDPSFSVCRRCGGVGRIYLHRFHSLKSSGSRESCLACIPRC